MLLATNCGDKKLREPIAMGVEWKRALIARQATIVPLSGNRRLASGRQSPLAIVGSGGARVYCIHEPRRLA